MIPRKAIRFCLGTLIVIAFLIALFAAGMAVYASTQAITYSQAWHNLWIALGNIGG